MKTTVPEWVDVSAEFAVAAGQPLDEFVAHCHPNNSLAAAEAYNRVIAAADVEAVFRELIDHVRNPKGTDRQEQQLIGRAEAALKRISVRITYSEQPSMPGPFLAWNHTDRKWQVMHWQANNHCWDDIPHDFGRKWTHWTELPIRPTPMSFCHDHH